MKAKNAIEILKGYSIAGVAMFLCLVAWDYGYDQKIRIKGVLEAFWISFPILAFIFASSRLAIGMHPSLGTKIRAGRSRKQLAKDSLIVLGLCVVALLAYHIEACVLHRCTGRY